MRDHSNHLSVDQGKLVHKIIALINERKYDNAMELIDNYLADNIDISTHQGTFFKAQLAGLLIDIGEEGIIEKAALDGLKIFENDRKDFRKYILEASLEYNIGNGKSALFKIKRSLPNFKFKPETIELLTDAKNHYWRAYKQIPEDDKNMRPQLIVNLANTLSESGRIVEALHYFDLAIIQKPDFSKAHANRSLALLWLNELSGSYSINLLQQAVEGYKKAAEDIDLPDWMIDQFVKKEDSLKIELKNLGYSEETIIHDIEETKAESETHSNFRKFCIQNHLTLSEHALYCNCIGSRHDDLSIPKTTKSIAGDFVPKMELILNRLKSEFALARLLYYQSNPEYCKRLETFNEEITFTELNENEAVGIRPEMVRLSFRICFGILDKIAHGICELFNLAEPNEPLYFESFWKPRGNNIKQKERWDKINSKNNSSLLALYSQATDLNSPNGEWGVFKEWRNAMEHKMLILTKDANKRLDVFEVIENQNDVTVIKYREFDIKTMHLLRLVRSAIFNFVFCVRTEGTKVNDKYINNGKAVPITLSHKAQ